MWKDFFYFNKGERRAILVLTILVALLQITIWTTDYWLPVLPEKWTKISARRQALDAFQDSLRPAKDKGLKNAYGYAGYIQKAEPGSSHYSKVPFNPNTADSSRLLSLGLRPYVVRNILKYRRKGGMFRKPEDFSRIYGISPEQYAQLKSYIRIDADKSASEFQARQDRKWEDREKQGPAQVHSFTGSAALSSGAGSAAFSPNTASVSLSGKSQEVLSLNINKVDTSALQQLKGVGAVTANRIVQYRNRLGGFYSVRQLEEIKGFYPDVLRRLQSTLKIDTGQIQRINANKASLEKLKAHPYISFYQAKVIVELRKARSGIKSINELAEFKEFTSVDMDRLKWYLSF
jgi:DNA uptake protein and related DNA-binding proteins